MSILTIAIPYYAGEKLLLKAVESVLRQRDSRWRLIVCDDCGQEPPTDLLKAYRDSRISYFRNDRNLGMAGNWNRCLDLADDDLVTLLHADDELQENYVETIADAAERHPLAAAIFCRAAFVDEDGRRCFSFVDWCKTLWNPVKRRDVVINGERGLEALSYGNFIICPTACYRKSQLNGQRFDEKYGFVLDLDFFCRLLVAGRFLVGLPDVAYSYRRHALSATVAYTGTLMRFEEELQYCSKLSELARSRGWSRAAAIAKSKTSVKLHILYSAALDLASAEPRRAIKKLALFGQNVFDDGKRANPAKPL